jgi:hypothetical protein
VSGPYAAKEAERIANATKMMLRDHRETGVIFSLVFTAATLKGGLRTQTDDLDANFRTL